jgi:hypothetical protein
MIFSARQCHKLCLSVELLIFLQLNNSSKQAMKLLHLCRPRRREVQGKKLERLRLQRVNFEPVRVNENTSLLVTDCTFFFVLLAWVLAWEVTPVMCLCSWATYK